MIKKIGNKTNRTVLMENSIFDYFKKEYNIELKHEYKLSTGSADFFTLVKEGDKIRDAIVVEIKQSASDFYSGCGLNFVGASNYIAVPSELVGFTIEFLREHIMFGNYIGVLEVTDTGMVRTVTFPIEKKNEWVEKRFICIPPYHLLRKDNEAE